MKRKYIGILCVLLTIIIIVLCFLTSILKNYNENNNPYLYVAGALGLVFASIAWYRSGFSRVEWNDKFDFEQEKRPMSILNMIEYEKKGQYRNRKNRENYIKL
jgi:hypothetical protein